LNCDVNSTERGTRLHQLPVLCYLILQRYADCAQKVFENKPNEAHWIAQFPLVFTKAAQFADLEVI